MLSYDAAVFVVCLVVAQATVGVVELLRDRGCLSTQLARKVMHIMTGTVFMAMWPLFSPAPTARYWAAVVPALVTLRFAAVGAGLVGDRKLVAGVARTGRRQELLGGPVLYGAVHTGLVVVAWRTHPAAVLALTAVCWGDGLADVVGRAARAPHPLPWNRHKTLEGSLACLLGSYVAGIALSSWYQHLGYFTVGRLGLAWGCAVTSLVGTAVESLPVSDIDNLLIAVAVAGTAYAVL